MKTIPLLFILMIFVNTSKSPPYKDILSDACSLQVKGPIKTLSIRFEDSTIDTPYVTFYFDRDGYIIKEAYRFNKCRYREYITGKKHEQFKELDNEKKLIRVVQKEKTSDTSYTWTQNPNSDLSITHGIVVFDKYQRVLQDTKHFYTSDFEFEASGSYYEYLDKDTILYKGYMKDIHEDWLSEGTPITLGFMDQYGNPKAIYFYDNGKLEGTTYHSYTYY